MPADVVQFQCVQIFSLVEIASKDQVNDSQPSPSSALILPIVQGQMLEIRVKTLQDVALSLNFEVNIPLR